MRRRFGDQEILRPSGQVLKIEANPICLSQRVQVDGIEPEQVVAGELPNRCHLGETKWAEAQSIIIFMNLNQNFSSQSMDHYSDGTYGLVTKVHYWVRITHK